MSFRLPIYDNWYAIGRWQYSWLYDTTQDGLFGVEKENCCWRFRIFGRHYINNLNNINNQYCHWHQSDNHGYCPERHIFPDRAKRFDRHQHKGDMDKFFATDYLWLSEISK